MFMPYLNDIQHNLKLPSAICVTRHFLRERVQVIQLVATGTIQIVQGRKDLENKYMAGPVVNFQEKKGIWSWIWS